jgi:hypothetical protein
MGHPVASTRGLSLQHSSARAPSQRPPLGAPPLCSTVPMPPPSPPLGTRAPLLCSLSMPPTSPGVRSSRELPLLCADCGGALAMAHPHHCPRLIAVNHHGAGLALTTLSRTEHIRRSVACAKSHGPDPTVLPWVRTLLRIFYFIF